MKRILTPKQKKLINAVISNPDATQKELSHIASYSHPSTVNKVLKNPLVQQKLRERMEKHPRLKADVLLDKLADGLDATKTMMASFQGQITDEREYADYAVRHAYLDTALKIRGDLQPDERGATNVQINFVDLLAEQSRLRGLEYHGPATDKAA